jgi:uncharacterized repeat protein (TIGR01451 family)
VREIDTLIKRDSRTFAAFCEELLRKGHYVRFRVQGASMRPNIIEDDTVIVAPVGNSSVSKGDVLLTQCESSLKVHRFVRQNITTGTLITRGDSGQENDSPTSNPLGRVIAVERAGRTISTVGRASLVAAKLNSTLLRLQLAFMRRFCALLSFIFPAALLLLLCLLVNISPAAAQTADVTVTESAVPATVSPGGTITYTIAVKNTSLVNNSTTPSWVQATPVNTTFQSITFPAGWSCTNPAVGGTGNVTCTSAANLAANTTKTFTMVVTVNAATAGNTIISSSVTVSSPNDSNLADNTATTSVTVLAADVAITETPGSPTVSPGGTISYTVVVTNNGLSVANAPVWTQVTPTNTTFNSITVAAGWTCVTPAVGVTGTITCTDGSALASGGSGTFTLVVNVPAATPGNTVISGTASVSSTTSDPTPANNTATSTVTVTVADLALTQTPSPTTIGPGGTITYTNVVTNNGPSAAVAPVFRHAQRRVDLHQPCCWRHRNHNLHRWLEPRERRHRNHRCKSYG